MKCLFMTLVVLLAACAELKSPITPTEEKLIIAAIQAVRNSMKNPDSVKFQDVRISNTSRGIVCGKASDGKGLLGIPKYTRFIAGESLVMDVKTNETFDMDWDKFCGAANRSRISSS